MPVRIPDPAVHKLCHRCLRWFEPVEGEMRVPEAAGPISGMLQSARSISGVDSGERFICFRCLRGRRWTKLIIFGAFGLVVAIAFLIAWLNGTLR